MFVVVSVNVTTSESRLLQACDRLSYGGCMLMTVLVHAACGVEQKFKVAMKAGMSGTGTVYGGGVGFSPRPGQSTMCLHVSSWPGKN